MIKLELFTVIQAGVQSNLQDLGRWGYQSYGVGVGGALSTYDATVANILVGNKKTATVLEISQSKLQLFCNVNSLICFTGHGMQPQVDETLLPTYQPILIKAGSTIHLKTATKGYRLFLAVAGGFNADYFLGSYATLFAMQRGGLKGRAIAKGDKLLQANTPTNVSKKIKHGLIAKGYFVLNTAKFQTVLKTEIRIIRGSDFERLSIKSQTDLIESNNTITNLSNRMGYRLKTTPLMLKHHFEPTSSAISKGTIQLLPDGQLIVLLSDCQTIGGYPKIAHVCTADLSSFAQLKPNDTFTFKLISQKEAEELFILEVHKLDYLKNLINQHFS